ncbi:MAG: hypothetical protein ACFFBD_18620 [Candidatus Hodarchaeota archaeon]
MNLRKSLLGCIVLLTLLATAAFPVNAHRKTSTSIYLDNEPIVSISIVDAFYDDLDADGLMDDVEIDLLFDFAEAENPPEKITVILAMKMVLPSGLTYAFTLEIWIYSTSTDRLLILTLLNTATESGWYTVSLEGIVRVKSEASFLLQDSFSFDPPTGKGTGNPTLLISVV